MTFGVGLISPPPHHDIYSIEDLAELIHDLKNSLNARGVKLVSEVEQMIAAGVAKAKAALFDLFGYDGGTALLQVFHSTCRSTLGTRVGGNKPNPLLNDLQPGCSRNRRSTQDRRDATSLFGAEELFATAPLVTLGCLMMRVCHKNTCPLIATKIHDFAKVFRWCGCGCQLHEFRCGRIVKHGQTWLSNYQRNGRPS